MDIIKELIIFLAHRKKLFLAPMILLLLIVGGLLVVAQGSVVGPLIYTIF